MRDPFTTLLEVGPIQIKSPPTYDVIPLGTETYQDTCISGSGSMLALVQQNIFEIYKVTLETRKWVFRLQCSKVRFGSSRTPTSAPWRVLATMSDRVLCLALPEKCITVYDVQGHFLGTIHLSDQCRSIVMSRCGQFVLVATVVGVYLYDAGQDGTFGLTSNLAEANDSVIVTRKLLESDNYWDDRGVANCMAFCPNSRKFSFCTRENIVHTYSIEQGSRQPILLYKFDRKFDRTNLSESYFGVTGLALYDLILLSNLR
jgi:hypothetical protein